ncbi:MAG: hydrogenase maturation nickel metallochaperone HypA [Coriobacteriaceae bacterium]|nr:hydrogenase maturation nickel metallochaperone HypA [Coriobacteriaceae bacterium]MDY3799363.1 hydrogenase maturation nickel metallochaperone HypA [Eggerthellaceae bacterium]MDD7431132.1 hydrogenase maturation nickel metallochaperone HypA [Coriobacteriaceae bacterium]MDO4498344.1 hydrogenase maturation nickel metallochaperone HypA [Coriobacteriaceae bacterium]MDY4986933.1 hydrogenase maturation nickel metallochaperone HypA [Eggerthellaceae bacterium]
MHELGIMTGVVETVEQAARDAGAEKVLKVNLAVGVMTEALEDALFFAFDVLKENTLLAQAQLEVDMVQPKSVCNDCGTEFDHDRFHVLCPLCEGANTTLIAGRELKIESIEVDLPD